MEINLENVKKYLRVESDDEDTFIEFLIEFSKEEIKNSTGDDGTNPSRTYETAQLLIISDRYENRGIEDREFKPNNALQCLFTKLKYKGDER